MKYENVMAATLPDRKRLSLFTAAELESKVFPPVSWIADDLIPEGLTLFCGKPKLGKSWAMLDLACSVAEGGQFLGAPCDAGDALYLALEDNQRRLQDRLGRIRPNCGWPATLSLATDCARLSEGGMDAIEAWFSEVLSPRLVVIDTLAKVKPFSGKTASEYEADYQALRGLHRLANQRGAAIVLVHHLRKASADDPFDMVSGSTGLTGAADATIVLNKSVEHGGCILYGRGRDLPEFEHGVAFDEVRYRWTIVGDPDTAFLSDTRSLIIAALDAGKQTPAAIAEHAGLSAANARQTLRRMHVANQVSKDGRGCYMVPRP